jgi:hypothetical protein
MIDVGTAPLTIVVVLTLDVCLLALNAGLLLTLLRREAPPTDHPSMRR